MLVGDISRLNARRYGDKIATICNEATLTWAQCDERANRLGSSLLALGMQRGDRVAVCARNCIEWPEIVFGLAKAGLVLVPINTRLAHDEVTYSLVETGVVAAIVHTGEVARLGEVFTHLETLIEIGSSGVGRSYEEVLAAGDPRDPTPPDLGEDDLRVLLLTSGTTGRPKAAMHAHRGMLSAARDHLLVTQGSSDDVCLAATPFFTAGGMMRTLFWTYLGQTTVILDGFDASELLDVVERRRVTRTTLVPTMLQRVLRSLENQPGRDLSSLKLVGYGSAPVPPALAREAMEQLGSELFQQYGLTESGGLVTILTPADHRKAVETDDSPLASCGRETPLCEIRILDDDGTPVADGAVGEIVLRSESVATGYWQRPDAWAETYRDGWLHTGDVGYRDEAGYIYLVDRRNDTIISGAYNVYPGEIERVLMSHAEVELAAVVGVPDDEWGERPHAFIVARQPVDDDTLLAELAVKCRQELAGYKQPRSFELRSDLPLTAAGKVLRRDLKEPLWAGRDRRV